MFYKNQFFLVWVGRGDCFLRTPHPLDTSLKLGNMQPCNFRPSRGGKLCTITPEQGRKVCIDQVSPCPLRRVKPAPAWLIDYCIVLLQASPRRRSACADQSDLRPSGDKTSRRPDTLLLGECEWRGRSPGTATCGWTSAVVWTRSLIASTISVYSRHRTWFLEAKQIIQ